MCARVLYIYIYIHICTYCENIQPTSISNVKPK